jgi:hypothetical protein
MLKTTSFLSVLILSFLINPYQIMRSLAELKKEAAEMQLKIRKLLLGRNSFDEGIADKLTTIATITTLREQLVKTQKEIRIRFPDAE